MFALWPGDRLNFSIFIKPTFGFVGQHAASEAGHIANTNVGNNSLKKMRRTYLVLFIGIMTSCGILGIYTDDNPYITDEDVKAEILKKLDNEPIARKMDSLLAKIDSAKTTIPTDLSQTTLIIETYSCDDFLRVNENKFNSIKNVDTEARRKRCEKYNKHKTQLIKDPKFKIIYADKDQYKNIDIKTAKYILKTTNRLQYTPSQLEVTRDSTVVPWLTTIMYYIYDRENHSVYKEIKDWSLLDKKG